MPTGFKVVCLIFLGILLAAPVQAAQLFPLETGRWIEMDKQDQLGNKWTVRADVLEEITVGGQKYFHLHQHNYDPNTSDDVYLRSTDTAVYMYNGVGENLVFQLGPVGTKWNWQEEDGTMYKEILAIESVTIPFGGVYQAYKYRQYEHYADGTDSPDCFEWLVPGLGLVQEQDYWIDNPAAAPYFSVLARVGTNPLLPMKTGTVLEYNSSDNLGQTWNMRMQVLEQVTLNGQQYFHLRQTDYDPFQDDTTSDMYIRSTDKEVYKFNGSGEDVAFRAADVGTKWDFPRSNGRVYLEIVDIAEVTVPYGGPYKAYVQRGYFVPTGGSASPYWYDHLVPGLTNVKIVDHWLNNPSRAPLIQALARILLGGFNPALNLLLE